MRAQTHTKREQHVSERFPNIMRRRRSRNQSSKFFWLLSFDMCVKSEHKRNLCIPKMRCDTKAKWYDWKRAASIEMISTGIHVKRFTICVLFTHYICSFSLFYDHLLRISMAFFAFVERNHDGVYVHFIVLIWEVSITFD